MYAFISLDARSLLDQGSTCTIGDATIPVPERHPCGDVYAPQRIVAAIQCLGYQPDGDYYRSLTRVPGGCELRVKAA